jgi:molybdenum cofactor cytidylyltransferase
LHSVKLFEHVSCIILSAGNSERMGSHKALLKFNDGSTFLEKIIQTYKEAGIEQVIVVVNTSLAEVIANRAITFPSGVEFVVNSNPEWGRFHSLHTGVSHLKSGNFCFFQNIDNPFVTSILLQKMICQKQEADLVIPVFQDNAGHPVLFNPDIVDRIVSTADSDVRIDQFLKQFSVKRIEVPDPQILININSKEEYLNAGFEV